MDFGGFLEMLFEKRPKKAPKYGNTIKNSHLTKPSSGPYSTISFVPILNHAFFKAKYLILLKKKQFYS